MLSIEKNVMNEEYRCRNHQNKNRKTVQPRIFIETLNCARRGFLSVRIVSLAYHDPLAEAVRVPHGVVCVFYY